MGRLDDVLGVSRQAARKVVEGLEQRSYVTAERDPADARRLIVSLTQTGQAYALAVVEGSKPSIKSSTGESSLATSPRPGACSSP